MSKGKGLDSLSSKVFGTWLTNTDNGVGATDDVGTRKGTNGVSTTGVTASFKQCFVDRDFVRYPR